MPTSIDSKNVTKSLTERLGCRIVSGFYEEGSRLPSEAQLCDEFHVSRPVLREAFKSLAGKGLVISRAKIGTLVQPQGQWNLLDPDILDWVTRSMPETDYLDMLFGVRDIFEPAMAAAAARQASEEQLEAISLAFRRMEAATSAEELVEPDVEFHIAIADATMNPLLSHIARSLHKALDVSIRLTGRHPDTHQLSVPRHRAVHDAIINRDAVGAAAACEKLLRESRADFDAVLSAKKQTPDRK